MNTTIHIKQNTPIGTISPRVYGHFAEHLGRCCYDGLWVGQGERGIAHIDGFRQDIVEALRALPVPMLRWPGGCYADHYHWRDGIGPADQRPVRLGLSCGLQVEDDNSLGTHEFLRLCALIGAEPYLAGNMGSGTPQELCDWLEYCNTRVNTSLARERAANGSPEPFGVKLWGVGNENWGCGGNYEPASYAREYVRYATMLRHVDPGAELVICGQEDAWNQTVMETVGRHANLIDHFSIHNYWINGGPEVDFNESEYYALLDEADATEAFIERTAAILHKATAGKQKIGIALDEWGVWHPEARPWGPRGAISAREPVTYEQANTLRDALAAGIVLEGFHRQCQVLSLANLAQIVNVLQSVAMTEGNRMWLTPTYHVLRMHRPHLGATALPVEVSASTAAPSKGQAVSATASQRNGKLAITVINRHLHEAASILLSDLSGTAQGELLAAESANTVNDADHPNRVAPVALQLSHESAGYRVELPPHSLATIVIG